MPYIVCVRLLLDVDSEAAAFDGTNEILRGQQRAFSEGSCLVDYAVDAATEKPNVDVSPDVYEEGEGV